MYRFKRNAVQARLLMAKTAWNFTGNLADVDTLEINEISPQLENTTALTDNAELQMTTTVALTAVSNRHAAFGVPIQIDQREDIYHYEVAGKAIVRVLSGSSGVSLVPFLSRHTAALVSNNAAVTNTTSQYKLLPSNSISNDGVVETSVEVAAMLEFDESDQNTGNLIFGYILQNAGSADRTVRISMNMSIKKYTEDLNTFDPTR